MADAGVDPSGRAAGSVRAAWWLLALIAVGVLAGRALGPSGLYQNTDECKTIACTADVALNGSWALQRDSTGTPNRKPPLLNWLGAPVIALGLSGEWAYKVPSILAALGMVGVTVFMAGRLLGRVGEGGFHRDDAGIAARSAGIAVAAGAMWMSSPAAVKHAFFGRQDMLFAALLGAAWMACTVALESEGRRRLWWSLAMWGATALAALTKGPLALLVPVYALAASLLIHRSWRRFWAIGPWWGIPLVVALPSLWVWAAWRVDPAFVEGELLGRELVDRVRRGTNESEPFRVLTAMWRVPAHVVERFAPWGALTLASLFLAPPTRWFRHPMAPAYLWLLLWYAALVAFAGTAGSFTLPMAPAVIVLCAYACARFSSTWSWGGGRLALCAAAVAAGAVGYEAFASRGARTGLGDRLSAFAREARSLTEGDAVVFVGTGHNPAPTLMRRHRAGEPTPAMIASADWVVAPAIDGLPDPVIVTGPIVRIDLQDDRLSERRVGIGLFRAGDASPEVWASIAGVAATP